VLNILKKALYKPTSSYHQFFLVGAVGGFGFIIDLGIMFALIYLLLLEPLLANTISVTIVIFINWFFNSKFVFQGNKNIKTEITQFFISSIAGLVLANIAVGYIYYILEWQTSLGLIVGKFIGLFLGIAIKFFLYKYWVFNSK
jgi:putative flippase GtrA